MKILVLNCGSSSIKYKLFDMDKNFVMAQGGIEKIGLPGSFLKLTAPNGEKVILPSAKSPMILLPFLAPGKYKSKKSSSQRS